MPLMQTVPDCGLIFPFKILSKVDFPTPLPPIMQINSPDSSLKLNFLIPFTLLLKRYSMSVAVITTFAVSLSCKKCPAMSL